MWCEVFLAVRVAKWDAAACRNQFQRFTVLISNLLPHGFSQFAGLSHVLVA